MNLTIRSHHTAVFDDLREHAETKLSRLDRYLPRLGEVVVEVEHEETRSAADRYSVQVTVHSGDTILRAEERAADPRSALDLAASVIARQAQRHGKRLRDWHKRALPDEPASVGPGARQPAAHDADEDEFDEYIAGLIVRVKRFDAKPMSHEEALAQMDLLGHDFFVFLDSSTGDYGVLYKRREGGYGLLTPARG